MTRKEFRQVCRTRQLCWGSVILEYMTPATVRAMARAGYSWLWIDDEHAAHSYETIQEVVRCAEDLGIITLLRVAQGEYARIAQALDIAVSGIIVPRVETADQVRHIVDCAKYPPIGKRGFGMRSTLFGRNTMSMADRIVDQNGRFLVIQLESPRAVENLEAILDVADNQIDAVFFGPADFQMAVGKPDHPMDDQLDAAVRRTSAICAERGISNGVPVTTIEGARLWIDRGFNLITYLSDDAFLSDYAAKCREDLRRFESP